MPTPGFTGQLAPARQQFLDSNGRPLAGGKIFHYLPGTTTPATTYEDPNFTTPNQNPVRLDAAGRASIYADRSLRQILQSSTGTIIWDSETVAFLGTNSSSALSLNTIADLRANTTPYPLFYVQGYYAAGDGADGFFRWDQADTTSSDNNGTIIVDAGGRRYKRLGVNGALSVKWFGAKGDGVTDDSDRIIDCITVAQGSNIDLVGFPAGDYLVTKAITITASGLGLVGTGESSIIRGNGNFNTFTFTGAALGQSLQGFSFRSGLKTGGYDIKVNSAFRCTFRNLVIFDTYGAFDFSGALSNQHEVIDIGIQSFRGPIAINWQGTNSAKVGGSDMCQVRVGETSFVGGGTALNIDGDVASLNLWGFFCNGAPAGASNLNYGIRVHNTIGATLEPRFIKGVNVQCEFAKINGVRIDAGEQITFVDIYSSAAIQTGIWIGSGAEKVSIVAPYVAVNGQHGIYTAARDVQITGGIISGNSQAGAFADNRGVYDGVHIAGAAVNTAIDGTRIGFSSGLSQRFGVYGASGALSISVSGCSINDNFYAGVRDDTGGALGNFRVSGCTGVVIDNSGGVIEGGAIGTRGWLAPTIVAGAITGATIIDPGFHYDVDPTAFVFDRGGGTGASLTVNVANGKITGVTVGAGGAGYSADTIIYLRPVTNVPSVRSLNPLVVSAELRLRSQGLGVVTVGSENGTVMTFTPAANTVNGLQAVGTASGSSPEFRAIGADAALDLRLIPKGGGTVNFGVYAAGAPAATGYITMKTQAGQTIQIPVRLV